MPITDERALANGAYSSQDEEDAKYLEEHFLPGTEWEIFEWGESRGTYRVVRRYEMRDQIKRATLVDIHTGREQHVFMFSLIAKPYQQT